MALPKQSGFTWHDHAADPSAAGEIQRNEEELKLYTEGVAQKIVLQRYPGVNPGVNLLRNPSFEVDADGTSPPTGWTDVGIEGAEVDDAEAFDGSKSLKIHFGVGANSCYPATMPALKKGQYVQVSCACKASEANKAYFRFIANAVLTDSAYHTGGGAWEILAAEYQLTADEPAPVFLLCNNAGASAAAWFDQAVLQVIDSHPKLDDLATPDDNTDLDVSTSAHGLCPKGTNTGTKFLRDDGSWQTPAGGGAPTKTVLRLVSYAAPDYSIGAGITDDTAWHVNGLDLVGDGLVSADATSVHLFIAVSGTYKNSLYLRHSAMFDANVIGARVVITGDGFYKTEWIALDSGQLDYYAAAALTIANIWVIGYEEPA